MIATIVSTFVGDALLLSEPAFTLDGCVDSIFPWVGCCCNRPYQPGSPFFQEHIPALIDFLGVAEGRLSGDPAVSPRRNPVLFRRLRKKKKGAQGAFTRHHSAEGDIN